MRSLNKHRYTLDYGIAFTIGACGFGLVFNSQILSLLGWSGGFRIVEKYGIILCAIGVLLLISMPLTDGDLSFRTTLAISVATLPIVLIGISLLPVEPILGPLAFTLLVWPSTAGLVLSTVTGPREVRTKALIVGGGVLSVLASIGLTVPSSRGPIGLYLLLNLLAVAVLASLFYVIGLTVRKPGPRVP